MSNQVSSDGYYYMVKRTRHRYHGTEDDWTFYATLGRAKGAVKSSIKQAYKGTFAEPIKIYRFAVGDFELVQEFDPSGRED